MKKVILSAAAALVLLASCGKSEVCKCNDTKISVLKEMVGVKGDQAKIGAILDKNKAAIEKCGKAFEGKSDADKKKLEDEEKKCDGYAEGEKLMKELNKQ